MPDSDEKRKPIAYPYVRTSTAKQVLSPKQQGVEAVKFYQYRLNDTHEISDFFLRQHDRISSTRALEKRPMGKKLIELLKPGDAVIVTHLDRLFRNLAETAQYIKRWDKDGITVHVTAYGMSTGGDNPFGSLFMQLLGFFAEFERILISERTKYALKHAKKKDRKNQYPGYGFKMVGRKGNRHPVPDQVERQQMALIVELHDQGERFHDIWLRFLRQNLKRSNGESWSVPRIRRAYHAELELRKKKTIKTCQEAP